LLALLGAHHILHVRGLRVNNIQRINHLYVSQKCAMWAELLWRQTVGYSGVKTDGRVQRCEDRR
jgi:hypothetical protein